MLAKVQQALHARITTLWSLSNKERPHSTWSMRVLWFLLCLAEHCYRLVFWLHQHLRRSKTPYHSTRFAVLAVGNISVGGTGKTVVIRFITQVLGPEQCAVLLRGYGAPNTKQPRLVHNGSTLQLDITQAGDEASLIAQGDGVCTAISANRVAGCMLLEQAAPASVTTLLLDDAYQNHGLAKQCEILLLDARAPFGNGHCLPAGPLREKDISRAHAVICTHADSLNTEQQTTLAATIAAQNQCPVFWGKHSAAGVWLKNQTPVPSHELAALRGIAVAGIGSFSGFVRTLTKQGANLVTYLEFPDHHAYSTRDLESIAKTCHQHAATILFTTEKDWVKLAPHITTDGPLADNMIGVLRVQFEFLSADQYSTFAELMRQRLQR